MRVVGAGLVAADIVLACDSSWLPLKAVEYTSGGTVTNVLTHLGYQGWDCCLVGGVGSDNLGSLVRKRLENFNVKTDFLITRKTMSTRRMGHLVAVTGFKKGEHRFSVRCPKCDGEFPTFSVVRSDELCSDPAFDSNTLLFIDRANSLTARLAEDAKNAGSTVFFEPGYLSNDRENRDIIQRVLNLTDILKYSQDLFFEYRPFSEHKFSSPKNAKLIIETRSASGVVVKSMAHRSRLRLTITPLTYAVDQAGAGDAFTAGFLIGLGDEGITNPKAMDERKLEEAVQRGQALGALACLYIGATSLLNYLSLKELNDAINQTIRERRIPAKLNSETVQDNNIQKWLELYRQTDAKKQFQDDSRCPLCELPKSNIE